MDPVTKFGFQVKEKTDVKVLGGNRMVAMTEECSRVQEDTLPSECWELKTAYRPESRSSGSGGHKRAREQLTQVEKWNVCISVGRPDAVAFGC